MQLSATVVPVREILSWRELFRQEMQCQIVHDSLHVREGWTESYLLKAGSKIVGYGAVAVAGPWRGTKTVFEFYVAPEHRSRAFDLFEAFVVAASVTAFEVQTNDVLLTVMLHAWCPAATSEKIIFEDRVAVSLPANGAILRRATPDDISRIFPHQNEPVGDWVLEVDGSIAATGGILFHYNRPYGDIYMEVAPSFRRRGYGAYLVQELKRICTEGAGIASARCGQANLASRKTIQKAGFVPCGHILIGPLVLPPAFTGSPAQFS